MMSDGRRVSMDIDPASQLSIDLRASGMYSSAFRHGGQDSLHMASSESMKHGVHNQHTDPLSNQSKKLQDDLHELGQKIKHHEDNIKCLQSLKNKVEKSILQMQAVRQYDKGSFCETVNDGPMKGEEETTEHILRHGKSAAALLSRLKCQAAAASSEHSLTEDVIGIVATLGKVDDDNLSRLLSEYLGQETMLAVVCKSQKGVKALEVYEEGSIDLSFGIHAFACSIGAPLTDRFLVICLDDLRPYPGEFIDDDPQRRLALLTPRLLNGETPPGFLGFAVNMITIDSSNLYCVSKNGHGLRETLFYNLLSNLQVYRSREDMLEADPCIRNGAISLDGGMIRSPGVLALGHHKGDTTVKFPSDSRRLNLPVSDFESESLLKQTVWKMDCASEDIKREQALLDNARFCYEAKKQEFLQILAGSSAHLSQHPAGRGVSTPR